MKTSHYILFFLLFMLCSAFRVQTEDSIVNRNVTVEREYKPVIQNAGKINSLPSILEPTVEKTAPNYSNFNLPLNAPYNIHILPAVKLNQDIQTKTKQGFGSLGFGNYYNTLADFSYTIIKKTNMNLDVTLNHLGTFSKKTHSVTKEALIFDKKFDKFDLYVGQGGGHEYFKYYGDNFNNDQGNVVNLKLYPASTYTEKDRAGINSTPQTYKLSSLTTDSNTFWRFESFVGIRSLPLAKGINYQAEVRYKLFDSHDRLAEHLFHSQAGFSMENNNDRIGIDIDLFNSSYHPSNSLLPNDIYSVFSFNPYYSIIKQGWDIRLGVKSAFAIAHGNAFNPSVDVRTEWKVLPKSVSVYGGITGSYDVNTLFDIFAENRFMFPNIRVENTYTPFNLFVGIKVKPLYNLLLDAYIDYRLVDNQYFFVNEEYILKNPTTSDSTIFTNRFNVIYSGASLLKLGLRANYNIPNRINVQLKGAYNGWAVDSQQYAWNKPKWEAYLSTDIHLTSYFLINAKAFFESERYAKLGNRARNLSPKVDINVGASYMYNSWLTAFVKLNNVINSPYKEFYGYEVQGINFLAGATFSF